MIESEASASLDAEQLLSSARTLTGLQDFGDESFREPFEVLLGTLVREADLNPAGRMAQHQRILDILVNRLRVEAYCKEFPQIADEAIVEPVVIVGLPRTGTTLLHRSLACDSRFLAPLFYELRCPAPPSRWNFRGLDPRIEPARAEVEAMLRANPELAAIHPLDPLGADEDILLLEQSFYSTIPPAYAYVPSYERWLAEHDNLPGYRYLKKLLQFLQWQKKCKARQNGQNSGQKRQRWLLKAPHHLHYMDVLLKVFPDAKVLQTHRDPLETIPSITSFHFALWKLACDRPDPRRVAEQWGSKFARGMLHTLQVRQQYEDRFLDIWYKDTVAQPLAVIEEIYGFLGMALTQRARAAMEAWQHAHRRDHRAVHQYSLEQFGYTREGLEHDFAAYRERFILHR